jgi:hypothetical protein
MVSRFSEYVRYSFQHVNLTIPSKWSFNKWKREVPKAMSITHMRLNKSGGQDLAPFVSVDPLAAASCRGGPLGTSGLLDLTGSMLEMRADDSIQNQFSR